MAKRALLWLRRDFRTTDHPALFQATRDCSAVYCVFVLDRAKLDEFAPHLKPFAAFFGALLALRSEFQKKGRTIHIMEGDPEKLIPELMRAHNFDALYFNKDYEPASLARDESVSRACRKLGATVYSFKDHVLFEESEILSQTGMPYKVFTPYKKACFAELKSNPPVVLEGVKWASVAEAALPDPMQTVTKLWQRIEDQVAAGQREAGGHIPPTGEKAARNRLNRFLDAALADYPVGRDLPAIAGTSRLSMDLRAGALSPRQIWNAVLEANVPAKARDVFRAELNWRDFFIQVGFHHPEVFTENYSQKFKRIRWRNDPDEFAAWTEGRTGYPIVDAGMRELVMTGFMHNRVRMITATFLCKDLLVDWRWGESFFRKHLVDGDAAINNGNWQWCASTGCDAQPYFRIFNPITQGKRFDPDGKYTRHYVKELAGVLQARGNRYLHEPWRATEGRGLDYPPPIVDHSVARTRCLLAFR